MNRNTTSQDRSKIIATNATYKCWCLLNPLKPRVKLSSGPIYWTCPHNSVCRVQTLEFSIPAFTLDVGNLLEASKEVYLEEYLQGNMFKHSDRRL